MVFVEKIEELPYCISSHVQTVAFARVPQVFGNDLIR